MPPSLAVKMGRTSSRSTSNSLAELIDFIETIGNVTPAQVTLGVELISNAKVMIHSVQHSLLRGSYPNAAASASGRDRFKSVKSVRIDVFVRTGSVTNDIVVFSFQ